METKRTLEELDSLIKEDVSIKKALRDGIEVEKGVVLTTDYLEEHREFIEKIMNIFSVYPDIYLDIITPTDSNFRLYFYQRLVLRAIMRYKEVYVTAPRAFSKSFLTILGMILQCIFIPGTRRFICAPNKQQSAKIANEKIIEIYDRYPLIKKEVVGGTVSDKPGNFGKDYVALNFRNGSTFEVVGALESTRGNRKHGGLIDEVRDQDETLISEVVLPLLNVSRTLPDGNVNPKEPNQQTVFMTSAGAKMSFAYVKLIDVFENSIIDPENSFCFGCDYRVPMKHGLLSAQFINKLKMSPSYNSESFAREYMSLWSGATDDSYFSYEKLTKYRKIKNPETHAINRANDQQFYLLSTDVGRLHDQTVVCVFRVNPQSDGKYISTLVNIYVLGLTPETKMFYRQAIDLKKLIAAFNPKEVVIDTNGLGLGLADEMIREQFDTDGTAYPPYGFINDDSYARLQPKDSIRLLWGIKANATLNPEINSNAYTRISNGYVRFLIKEQEAKTALLATKVGQKMSVEERVRRLMPHEMTTKLFEEMANLRLKRTGDTSKVNLERINARFPKDKYSSFAYGQWRIKELEEKKFKQRHKSAAGSRKLVFYDGG